MQYSDFVEQCNDELKREEEELLPECSECGEKITDDTCYEINGEYICIDCMENRMVRTRDIVL